MKALRMADNQFNQCRQKSIDILLGNKTIAMLEMDGNVVLESGVSLCETRLRWICKGLVHPKFVPKDASFLSIKESSFCQDSCSSSSPTTTVPPPPPSPTFIHISLLLALKLA